MVVHQAYRFYFDGELMTIESVFSDMEFDIGITKQSTSTLQLSSPSLRSKSAPYRVLLLLRET